MRLIALALLLLSLSACGAAATDTPDDSTGTAPSTPAASTAASPAASVPAASAPSGSVEAGGGTVEAQASSFLATQLNLAADDLTLQSKEQVEWNDGSLGCPQPGMMYTQAIVPGYKLTFSADGKTYELHTDESGQQVVWCEGGQPKQIGQP